MKNAFFSRTMQGLVAAAAAMAASSASAAISVGTDLGGGTLQNVSYGATGIASIVQPLLFVSDLGGTLPPAQQVQGTDLGFSASVGGNGTSVLDIVYTISNTGTTDTFTDLRFMLGVQPDGDGAMGASATFLDNVSEVWGAKASGDPDARQVQSLLPDLSNALVGSMAGDNGVTDGANACPGACDADFGLQWNRASLAPGETWAIGVRLVDDPALVGGGRFLVASSVTTADTNLFVGNIQAVPEPGTYAMLAAGLGLIGTRLVRGRRR